VVGERRGVGVRSVGAAALALLGLALAACAAPAPPSTATTAPRPTSAAGQPGGAALAPAIAAATILAEANALAAATAQPASAIAGAATARPASPVAGAATPSPAAPSPATTPAAAGPGTAAAGTGYATPVAAGAAAANPYGAPAAAGVVRSVRGNLQSRLAFAGAVLVPPDDLEPFVNFSVGKVESPLREGPGARAAGSYAVRYGDGDGAVVEGFYRLDRKLLLPDWEGCAPAEPRCTRDSRAGPYAGPPAEERFQGLEVDDLPATVTHLTCCNGVYWDLFWWDAGRETIYHLGLSGAPAQRLGTRTGPESVEGARQLVGLAERLVRLEIAPATPAR